MLRKIWNKIKEEAVLITMIVLLVLSFVTFCKNQVLWNEILELINQVQVQIEDYLIETQ